VTAGDGKFFRVLEEAGVRGRFLISSLSGDSRLSSLLP